MFFTEVGFDGEILIECQAAAHQLTCDGVGTARRDLGHIIDGKRDIARIDVTVELLTSFLEISLER